METAQSGIPYCGPAPEPGAWLAAWNPDPVLWLALAAALAGGVWAQDRRLFLLAWAGLVLAFASPLCALTAALFSARAVHHLLLLGLVAPALAAALPLRAALGPAFGLTAAALAAWHLPAVYAAAWDSAAVYWLMQAALLLPAWAFWSAVLAPRAGPEGLLLRALAVAGLAGAMGLIGAVLTFADRILYPQHLAATAPWGLTALEDQQLAGLVMWVPGLAPLALAAGLMARRAWQDAAA